LLALSFSGCSQPHRQALDRFAEAYIRDHETGNIEGLLDRVDLPDDRPELRQFVRIAFLEETQWPLLDLQIERLSSSEQKRMRDSFSLEPLWRVYVILDTEDRFTSVWFAGIRDERVFLLVEDAEEPGTLPEFRRDGV